MKERIKVNIEGASLTDEERQELTRKIEAFLNKEQEKEETGIFKKVKDKIDDAKWNLGVKWNMLDKNDKMVLGTLVLGGALAIGRELRLAKREARLQRKER